MAYDSENIPLVTRIESGDNTQVSFSVNSEGEGVYVINSLIDSDFVKSVIQENPAIVDSEIVFNMIREHTASSDISGDSVTLNGTSDGSLAVEPGIIILEANNTVSDAIDRLNEASRNILRNTAVANLTFTGDNLVGGAGFTTTLTTVADGTPNRFDVYWGDGTVDSDSSDSTPSHTYNSNTGSPFTVKVVARNNSGEGAGSFSIKERSNYIIVYTATPVVSFAVYAASSGGSAITSWDDGATVYFQNNTTNTSNATATYNWNFGDSDGVYHVTSDGVAGGSVNNGGSRLPYTFDSTGEIDKTFNISLTLNSHTTANPADLPIADSDNNFKVYDTHTPSVSINDSDGINEETTSGHIIQATNNSSSGVGSYADYGNQYVYVWGDGTSNNTVNVGSGASGDRGASAISHTYALSSSNQANGVTTTFNGELRIVTSHSSSPFVSETFKITVKPDLRINLSATASTVSDRIGDTQYDLYYTTGYDNNNRASITITNTSQNVTNLLYDFGYNQVAGVGFPIQTSLTENGTSAGSTGATLSHQYPDRLGVGSFTLKLTGTGSPGGVSQSDSETVTINIKATPPSPDALSDFSFNLSTAAQYDSITPKLAKNFTDNTGSDMTAPGLGSDLNTSTARRYTPNTVVETITINNCRGGTQNNVLKAIINSSVSGSKSFTNTINETGTFTNLIISQQGDAHDTISASTYFTGLFQTFDAKISKNISTVEGVHAFKLQNVFAGVVYTNSNVVYIVNDTLTDAPTIENAGTVAIVTPGTYRYISGIPYFNSGSPVISIAGLQISDLTGQTYLDNPLSTSVVEVTSGDATEGSGSGFTTNGYNYGSLNNPSNQMWDGNYVDANVGRSSPYTTHTFNVPITSSSVALTERLKIRAQNANGFGSYLQNSTLINIQTASQSGISELSIAVSNSLGSSFTDNAVRSAALISATTDTPTLRGSSFNYYTTETFTESADPGVAGTKEASIRFGVVKHDVTNYSTYIPAGPNRSGDTGNQYFTIAFRRSAMANFVCNIVSSTGIAGMFIAAPGTTIDNTSSLNGWLDCGIQYAGAGVPGSDTGNGGNGSNGCASTGSDVIGNGSLNGAFRFTLGTQNSTNADNNVVLLRIALSANDTITSLSIS